jgi:TRAP-type mannitol/chloroaromatic compound transport system permease large subunit
VPDIYVRLNHFFAGMMPFMGIQVLALSLLCIWPPNLLYK